jgi:hypothetical protein
MSFHGSPFRFLHPIAWNVDGKWDVGHVLICPIWPLDATIGRSLPSAMLLTVRLRRLTIHRITRLLATGQYGTAFESLSVRESQRGAFFCGSHPGAIMSTATEIKPLGATPHEHGVSFRVWAPHAFKVSVIGSFNCWEGSRHPMQAEENGNWFANVAEAKVGDEYRYLLTTPTGQYKRIDPYARAVTNSIGNAIVHDPRVDWEGDGFQHAPWNELVIYELHVGTFNDEADDTVPGEFKGVTARLGHLNLNGNRIIGDGINEIAFRLPSGRTFNLWKD